MSNPSNEPKTHERWLQGLIVTQNRRIESLEDEVRRLRDMLAMPPQRHITALDQTHAK